MRRTNRELGQALAEFVIVVPVLLLLFATVLDFGRLFYTKITIENAARAGVLIAAQVPASYAGGNCTPANAPNNKIGCAIQQEANGSAVGVQAADIAVSCENLSGAGVACGTDPVLGLRSRVGITTEFTFLMPILGMVFPGGSIPVSASVTADQQFMPEALTILPTPTPAPTPTPTPAPTPTPTPDPLATPTPTPRPTATPRECVVGIEAVVPDLVVGATGGTSTETVEQAWAEWATAGFQPSAFSPRDSNVKKKTVLTQDVSVGGMLMPPGTCASMSDAVVTVTHS